jgi:autotransporter-associated beta strand protein
LALLGLSALPASGDLYWDVNGANFGGSNTPTALGIWGVNSFWSSSADGDMATMPWTDGENAIFSAGTNVTGAYTVTVSGIQAVNNLVFEEGQIILGGGELNLGGQITTSSPLTSAAIFSLISGSAGLNKDGGGNLSLLGANTFTGDINVNEGRLVVFDDQALGVSNAVHIHGSKTVFAIQGGRTIANDIELTDGNGTNGGLGQLDSSVGSNTLSGTINLSGSSDFPGSGLALIGVSSGALTHTGVIQTGSGDGSFGKVGPGTLVLSGSAPNTYDGTTQILGGNVIAEKDGAFGDSGGGIFLVSNATITHSVGFRAPVGSSGFDYTATEMIYAAGFSNEVLGQGLIHNFGGDNTFAGNIKLDNPMIGTTIVPSTIGAEAGSSLTIFGSVSNRTGLAHALTKVGAGTIVFSGTNTMYGPLVVSAGTLSFRSTDDPNTGQWNPASASTPSFVSVAPGAKLRFDNTLAVNVNRTAASVAVNIYGGEFELVGNAGTADTDQTIVGGLNALGDSTFTIINPGSGTTKLSGINRISRATMFFRGADLGTGGSRILLSGGLNAPVGGGGAAGSPTIGILPFASGSNSPSAGPTDFVTYEANGVRVLSSGEYANGISSGSASLVNVAVNNTQNVNANTTVNSIKLAGPAAAIAITPGAVLTVNSGAVLSVAGGPTSIAGGAVEFGGAEGIITTATGSDLTISSEIRGSKGVTKSGGGSLTLGVDNKFTGPLTVDGGSVVFSTDSQLGPEASGVILNGGFLAPSMTTVMSPNRKITLTSLYTGIDVPSGRTLGVGGTIDGAGALTKNGGGTLRLGNGNSYSGGTIINGGVISADSQGALGAAAPITLNGGILQFTQSDTLNTLSSINLTGNNGTIDVAAGKTLTVPVYVYGQGSLIKTGMGTLVLAGIGSAPGGVRSNYIGTTLINEGTLSYRNLNGLSIVPTSLVPNYWSLSNGATLQLDLSSTGSTFFGSENLGIRLSDGGAIDITAGHTWAYNSAITGVGDLAKTGAGTLQLTGLNNVVDGALQVNDGTFSVSGAARFNRVVMSSTATLKISGVLNIAPSGSPANVSVMITPPLFSDDGKLDLNDNDLIVQAKAGTGQDVLSAITVLVSEARNTFPIGWAGSGITSSAAAANAKGITGLAIVLNDNGHGGVLHDKFDGVDVNRDSILVKYTYNGDTDLSGKVDADDYFHIDRGFLTHLSGYANGDFDFNGEIDADDYFLIDNAFVNQGGIVLSGGGLNASTVPEPGMLAWVALAVVGAARRRKR